MPPCPPAGLTLGLISDRGRETILHFAVNITYSIIALGLLSTVGGLGTFSRGRLVFYRESAAGARRGVTHACMMCVGVMPAC